MAVFAVKMREIWQILWELWHSMRSFLDTVVCGYPDPFITVPTRCSRLRMHKAIVPRKMTLVLDLDETLVHSSPKRLFRYDYKIHIATADSPVGCWFFVAKRPHIDRFLRAVSRWFEIVVFTASLQHYADPVIDLIDPDGLVCRRFFRTGCVERNGNLVKDLSNVRGDLSQVVIVDNSPTAYSLHEANALPIETWHDDPTDQALLDLLPVLSGLSLLNDVRSILSLRHTSLREVRDTRDREAERPTLRDRERAAAAGARG
uniref:FCP1 homology domain-containing protein n=2 Tax=Hemiselmis andersenii TaxID=464988 RepID=A0A6U2GHI8_HEMAN|mmetsp:Transcript_36641/g.85980  ORF Transcript_36641/g.85980 Transcript_36641/m.85980 type:complete len:260 (+) Transcript_36641:98-877(+)